MKGSSNDAVSARAPCGISRFRIWKSFEHPVIDHRLSALRGFLAWLKDRHQCPFPGV
jgi:hypothetical protein